MCPIQFQTDFIFLDFPDGILISDVQVKSYHIVSHLLQDDLNMAAAESFLI
jgi:hypothetical protein